jgi:hypothetical protein
MRPSFLCLYLLSLLTPGVQAVVLSYGACIAACAGTAAGWNSFCGATATAAAGLGIPYFTPACYSAGIAFGTPAGQNVCRIACNMLIPA